MSIYLSYDVEVEGEKIITAAFSNTDIPVLAVSTNKGKITFFQEEGCLVPDHDLEKDSIVTALCWHPNDMILAYGLEDGHLGVWVDEENTFKEDLNHEGKVCIIKFNKEGNRIVSSDDKGMINVWSFSPLYNLCTYTQSHSILQIIMPNFSLEKMENESDEHYYQFLLKKEAEINKNKKCIPQQRNHQTKIQNPKSIQINQRRT